MKRKLTIRTAMALAVASSVWLAGCCDCNDRDGRQNLNVKTGTTYGSNDGRLVTVEHDKHLFIVEQRYSKGAMLHHPDCPCGKSR